MIKFDAMGTGVLQEIEGKDHEFNRIGELRIRESNSEYYFYSYNRLERLSCKDLRTIAGRIVILNNENNVPMKKR